MDAELQNHPESLTECFQNHIIRNVNNDSCISIDGAYYDSPEQFISMTAELSFLSPGIENADILYDSVNFPIRVTNKVANGKTNVETPCIPLIISEVRYPPMFKAYYRLAYNRFDKQKLKERDSFLSHDHKEMMARVDYLKEIRVIWGLYVKTKYGEIICLTLLCCFTR